MRHISHSQLLSLLDLVAKSQTLIAPKDMGKGHLHLRPVEDSSEIVFEYTRTDLSAKEMVLPHTERIMRFENRSGEITITDLFINKDQVVFGLRPCDAHGIASLDSLFIRQDPVDRHYSKRRDSTTLVGISCPQMWDSCFCTSVGGSPTERKHLDVLLTENEDGYFVDCVTERGEMLFKNIELEEVEQTRMSNVTLNDSVPVPEDNLWPTVFDHPYWQQVGARCLSCKLCTFVCPTCRCFDLRDEPVTSNAETVVHERIRTWDACTSPNYRTIAGGHNSRPQKGQRIRNRFYCKFHYYPVDYGAEGCVGCGRCIDVCPVNIDIVEVLHNVDTLLRQPATEVKEETR
ncbi:MAG: 4Fe-4S dicluster domain-containing protein [Chloroflexota bacterium]